MILSLAFAGCDAVPSAEASFVMKSPPSAVESTVAAPVGTWNVVWDRSSTGWRPPLFHGTLVIGEDGTVGVDWLESTDDPELRLLEIDGHRFRIEWTWPSSPSGLTVVEGAIHGEELVGQITGSDGKGKEVPWSPVHGRRVPTLRRSTPAAEER